MQCLFIIKEVQTIIKYQNSKYLAKSKKDSTKSK
jgi:hypothetical protein